MMYFPQSHRKVTNQILVWEKHGKTFNCFVISHTKEAEVGDTFLWGLESDTILYVLKVEVLLPIYQNQNNTETSKILSKLYHNVVEGIKVLDDNL